MIRDVFNWLAAKPSSQYTLGGDESALKLNRAGRLVERIVSIPPLVVGAGLMVLSVPAVFAGAPVAASFLAAGALTMAFGKAAGLIKGGITHLIAKGASSLANHLARPKQETPQQLR